MRLVLDTNVVVAAFRSPAGASARLLELAPLRRIQLLASSTLTFEYEAALKRPAHLAAANAGADDVDRLLDALLLVTEKVSLHYMWRPQLDDPDDEHVLETAVNGRADALATFETGTFLAAGARFGVAVLTPSEALRRQRQ